MQVNVSGHHVEVTPALKQYVHKKLSRITSHFEHITSIDVILSVEKSQHKAEVTIFVKGANINATAESNDMYAAIDELSDKANRQLVKHKEKALDRNKGARN